MLRRPHPPTFALIPLLLLAACGLDEQEFKPAPLPTALEIRDAGTNPATPVAFGETRAWMIARNAESARVFAAIGAAELVAVEMSAVSAPDAFLWVRYEAELPRMDDENGLRIYFEATKASETRLLPPTAPSEVINYLPNLPDFPASYVTPAQVAPVPRDCEPDPEYMMLSTDTCSAQWVMPFPTMHKPNFVAADLNTTTHTITRGIGVDFGNGESYFFPLSVMLWHEGSNHTLGGVHTAMTYCPLTDTAVFVKTGFDPVTRGKNDKFNITGAIYNSNLVIGHKPFDNVATTYPQIIAFANRGRDAGRCLEVLPSMMTEYSFWLKLHPETLVLNGDPDYPWYEYHLLGNPYDNYWRNDAEIRAPICYEDSRRPNKSNVIGLYGESGPVCYILDSTNFAFNTELDGRPIAVLYLAGIRTAHVVERVLDGETIELSNAGFNWEGIPIFVDDAPDPSFWTIEGVAVAGPRAGRRLAWMPSMYAFWFGWLANFPESRVIDPISGAEL